MGSIQNVANISRNKSKKAGIIAKDHLKMGVESKPETLCRSKSNMLVPQTKAISGI
jgi:hypothetical protein